jgi:hypothetical protein
VLKDDTMAPSNMTSEAYAAMTEGDHFNLRFRRKQNGGTYKNEKAMKEAALLNVDPTQSGNCRYYTILKNQCLC